MAFGGFGQQTQPFGGFGQQSQPAFGAPASSPFGGGGAFGGQTPAFGAPAATGFGASQPAFGASQPAFGASPSFGGAGAFGARPAGGGFGFGSPAPAASPFGASAPAFGASAPAFGAASTPAFGAASTPAFGASSSPFGMSTPAFGAPASQPAFGGFGAASTPAFGAPASQPAFGGFGAASTPAFGAPASQPAFGAGGSGFGGGFGSSPPAASQGTRIAPYTRHQDKDQSGGASAGAAVYYNTITALPAYANKSVEELRWEDYQAGVKNASAAPAPAGGGFGTPASQPAFGGFGASPAPAFGAAAPAANPFGAPAPASPFGGGFGATSTPAFGAPASSPFGASTPAFGAPSSTPSFGGFGAASTPAFGAASSGSLFGAASSTGGFGFGTNTPAFGAPTSTPAFGAQASTPSFGGFGATPASSPFGASPASSASPFGTPSPSPFGAAAPSFGAAPSSSPFGGFGSTSASSASTFGGFGSSFGAKPASTPGFGFGASSTPAFGAPPAPAGGAFSFSAASTGGFGNAFGAAATTPAFSFSQPASQPAAGGFNFGGFGSSFGAPAQSAPAAAPAPAAQPAGVGQAPYGALSPLPSVNVPEPKVGISARPSRGTITTLRPSPLLTLRSATPRFGAGPAPRSGTPGASPTNLGLGTGLSPGASPASALLPARENPHRLFIREPPPSTSASPARGSLTPATPIAGAAGAAGTPPASAPVSARPPTGERAVYGEEAPPSAKRAAEPSPTNGYDTGSDLLPKLGAHAAAGYSYDPSPRQLQALATSDPDALAALEGFMLSRRGVGSLRWLVPVDVRGLELDKIASIEQGEVAVYTQCPKPPVGSELNTSCEVTLLNVYKKKGGQVVTDSAAVASFEKRLRRYCAESGAEFVAYKPDGGVWRFRVEHFSRYGVPMDDDGEEDEDQDGEGDEDALAGSAGDAGPDGSAKGRRLGAGGLGGDSDLDEATIDGDAAGGGDDTMGDADLEDGAALSEGAFEPRVPAAAPSSEALYAARTALPSSRKRGGPVRAGRWEEPEEADGSGVEPLQHRLPALLSLQPGQLAAMRDSFFRFGGATAADAASAEAASAVALPGEGALVARLSAQDQQQRARGAAQQRGHGSTQHNWARPRPALLGGGEGAIEPSVPSSTVLVAGPSSPTRLRAAAARSMPLVPRPAAGPSSVCDAFMLMGRSFRPSFGPGGQLAVPVNATNAAGGPAPLISISRVSPLTAVRCADSAPAAVDAHKAPPGAASRRAPSVAALRRRTLEALEAHLAMSVQADADAEDGGEEGQPRQQQAQQLKQSSEVAAPSWELVCSRRQLPDLVQRQLSALGRPDAPATAHAAELWQLVQVLFEHIEGEGDDDGDGGSVADAMSVGGDDYAASVLGGDRGRARLAAFKRRAALSQWLASRASQAVRDAVAAAAAAGGRDALPWALLHLVAGHQLGAAAALAAAAGDVRLSVLLATAGRHGAQSGDLAKQLQVWHSAGLWRDHFSQPRKLLLAILSGRMGEASAALGLDWPRALGLALWYSTPQTEGLADAVACYEAALAGPHAVAGVPPPVPPHSGEPAAAVSAPAAGAAISQGVASDAQYELLLLAARGVHGAGPLFTARLLRAAGRTANPLDAMPGWVLASTLRALGELGEDAAGEPDAVLLRLALDAVQQLLLMASGREAAAACCWAVYAVLHLAPALASSPARTAAARSLLELTAPHWAGSRWARDFLANTLGLPPAWLSSAQALWAGYLGDAGAQLDHLLDAGAASEAHALFVASVAPGLFLDATPSSIARLAALAGRLATAHTAIGPSWAAGGGLYDAWCRLYVAGEGRGAGAGGWRRDVVAEAAKAGGDAPAAVVEAASLLAQQLVAAGQATAAAAGAQGAQRRAVLARMSADAGQTLARLGGGAAAAAATSLLQTGCATLASHQPVSLSGLAAELAVS